MQERIEIKNRKASFDYFFIKEYVAGIVLLGSEVKQIKRGKISLVDAFCYFENGELFLKGMNITATEESFSHDPYRIKKLLLKRDELKKMKNLLDEGVTIVVKKVFSIERGLIKIEIAVAKGKKNYDKRASIKEREIKKELKQYNK